MTVQFFPVQLEDYTVIALHCVTNLKHDPSALTEDGPYSLHLSHGGPSAEAIAQEVPPLLAFHLTIRLTKNSDAAPYDLIEITLGGRFSLGIEIDEAQFRGFVVPHAMSLLFGVGRGILGSVTSWFPNGKFICPSIAAGTFSLVEEGAPRAQKPRAPRKKRGGP